MSPVRYFLPRDQRTHVTVDRKIHLAVKEYAETHNMTVAAALHLIILQGLKWLKAIEEKQEKDRMKLVLKFYKLYKERQQRGMQKNSEVEDDFLKLG